MGRARQSVDVLLGKGNRSHLTKAEIKERAAGRVEFGKDNITVPSYLTEDEATEFEGFVAEMIDKGIVNNLCVDSLASFFVGRRNYLKFTAMLDRIAVDEDNIKYYNQISLLQDRAYKMMRQAAADNGLTITSQNRLVAPKTEEKRENKFDKFAM
jgi:P27 family predicted phage terminase small subunit